MSAAFPPPPIPANTREIAPNRNRSLEIITTGFQGLQRIIAGRFFSARKASDTPCFDRDSPVQLTYDYPLGSGKFGTVHSAQLWQNSVLLRECAIKVARTGHFSRDEILHHQNIKDPALPQYYGHVEATHPNSADLIIMEKLDGVTLAAFSRSSGKTLPLRVALSVVAKVAETMHRLNTEATFADGTKVEFIHGDLSLKNIMITPNGIKLIDLGTAQSTKTNADQLIEGCFGVKGFIAPEIFCELQKSQASEVFSLGWLLLSLIYYRPQTNYDLTLKDSLKLFFTDPIPRPVSHFKNDSPVGTMREELTRELCLHGRQNKLLRKIPKKHWEAVADCLYAMLRHTPEDRISFKEVAQRLNDLASQLPGPTLEKYLSRLTDTTSFSQDSTPAIPLGSLPQSIMLEAMPAQS